jgi:uncharacterized membrane protein YoaK (UPF0700 family)
MYLEILTGAGSLGLLALVWLLICAGTTMVQRLKHAHGSRHIAGAAMLAALAVVAGHGLVDSFLSFTTTYVTFALAAGVAFSSGLETSEVTDANRV